MGSKHCLLIASQPAAYETLQPFLAPLGELVHVKTTAQAFVALSSSKIDLIISTIAFDDSQMLDFLRAAKGIPSLRKIPFLCCRVLPTVLPTRFLSKMRTTCLECGAADFLDLAGMEAKDAERSIRTSVRKLLA
jgi:hypothetical protein